jgi:GT2 family glycosyltransferase
MKIAFALPGNSFSSQFFINWNLFMFWMKDNGIEPTISVAGGSNVVQVRERCLRPINKGIERPKVPFYGAIEYDYIMWIDSDTMFQPEDFKKLLDRNVDIVSARVKMDPVRYSGMPIETDEEGRHRFFTEDDFKKDDLIECAWASMAFMLVKKSVFESIEPPWFMTTQKEFNGRKDILISEDIYFSLRARESGFKVWLDPKIKVGHQKLQIL